MIVGSWYVDPGRRRRQWVPARAPGVVLVLARWGPRDRDRPQGPVRGSQRCLGCGWCVLRDDGHYPGTCSCGGRLIAMYDAPRNVLVRPHRWWVDGLGWVDDHGPYEVIVDGEPIARRGRLLPSGDRYVRPFRGLRRPALPIG